MNYKNIAFAIMGLGVFFFSMGIFDHMEDELITAMANYDLGAKILFAGLLLGAIASLKKDNW